MARRASAGRPAPAFPGPPARREPLRIASHRSRLAWARAEVGAAALARASDPASATIVTIETGCNRDPTAPLAADGDCGLHVQAVRQALLDGRADLAVHSITEAAEPAAPISLGAVLPRGDPRDALVASGGRRLAELPAGARVGTGSRRGASLLRALRPDLVTADAPGDVDTRLRLVAEGRYDAMLLALAGLALLGRAEEATQIFDASEFVPAPGQGAIAIECRADDLRVLELLAPLDHPATRAAVAAERGVVEALGGGGALPVGALATVEGELVSLRAMLADTEGAPPLVGDAAGHAAEAAQIGRGLGRQLRGAVDVRGSGAGR